MTLYNEVLDRKEGFTYHPVKGRFLEIGEPFYVVSTPGSEVRVPAEMLDENIIGWYFGKVAPFIVGGWLEGDTYYFDKSILTTDEEAARSAAIAFGQKAYFDLRTGTTVYVNADVADAA